MGEHAADEDETRQSEPPSAPRVSSEDEEAGGTDPGVGVSTGEAAAAKESADSSELLKSTQEEPATTEANAGSTDAVGFRAAPKRSPPESTEEGSESTAGETNAAEACGDATSSTGGTASEGAAAVRESSHDVSTSKGFAARCTPSKERAGVVRTGSGSGR